MLKNKTKISDKCQVFKISYISKPYFKNSIQRNQIKICQYESIKLNFLFKEKKNENNRF